MALPATGQPISFEDINDELGNSSQATLDLKSASEALGESDAPFGMDELAGLSDDGITFSAFAAAQGSGQGEIDVSWTLSTPSGVTMATNGFVLKGSANSDMSSPTTELQNSNGAGSPFTDSSLGNNTQRYYQATTTTTAGTVINSSIVNATTQVAEVDRTLERWVEYDQTQQGGSDGSFGSHIKVKGYSSALLAVEDSSPPSSITEGGDLFENPQEINIDLSAIGGFSDGNTATIDGTQSSIGSNDANFNGAAAFYRNSTDSKAHQIATNGVISNTVSFTPETLTISLVSKDNNSVTVRASGDTRVIRTLRFYRDTTEGTKTDHTQASSATADFTFSGLAANTPFAFKVRGENLSGTGGSTRAGGDSNTINITTDADPIVLSPTSLSANGGGTSLPFVAESGTLTVTYNVSPAGTLKVFVNNTSNCRFKQATTSGGLSSASFGSFGGTNYSGGNTLTLSSSQVFLQFEITLTSGTSTSRTFTISDNTNSETIVFNVTNLGR